MRSGTRGRRRTLFTRLVILVVEDPLLMTALDLETSVKWTREASQREAAKFVSDVFRDEAAVLAQCQYRDRGRKTLGDSARRA